MSKQEIVSAFEVGKVPVYKDTPEQKKVRQLLKEAGFPIASQFLNFRDVVLDVRALNRILTEYVRCKKTNRTYMYFDPALKEV
jgi:hypothetical protein